MYLTAICPLKVVADDWPCCALHALPLCSFFLHLSPLLLLLFFFFRFILYSVLYSISFFLEDTQ